MILSFGPLCLEGGESMLDKALAALKTLAKAAAVLAVVAEAGIKVVSLLKG